MEWATALSCRRLSASVRCPLLAQSRHAEKPNRCRYWG